MGYMSILINNIVEDLDSSTWRLLRKASTIKSKLEGSLLSLGLASMEVLIKILIMSLWLVKFYEGRLTYTLGIMVLQNEEDVGIYFSSYLDA